MKSKNAFLIILDGWGHSPNPKVSALAQAKTPTMDALYKNHPTSELITFGEEVGLPEGQMGNSEVGHLNIGAGRIVYQELARINKAIREKTFHQHPEILKALDYARKENKAVHLMGLLSDGGVHSHINHLKALCDITEEQKLSKVYIHAFMDGRDTAPNGGKDYVKDLLSHIQNKKVELATLIGRYYAMDRDNRWERIKLAYDLLVNGKGDKTDDVLATIQANYDTEKTDEFLPPIVCTNKKGQAKTTIQKGDVVIFFNFRTDRPREITKVLHQINMPEFGMKKQDLYFLTMTRYDQSFKGVKVIYTKDDINETLGEVISNAGLTQLRIAETEKYPHVTFFFSGGREQEFPGEDRIVIPSPKVATYDLQPEMSAPALTESIIEHIQKHQPNFICLNYANTDMVGHTGIFTAAVKAAEVVDTCLGKLLEVAQENNYEVIIIADHGNSDYMINEDGTPNTAHTKNMVPCIYVGKEVKGKKLNNGRLADVAPTLLGLMGIEQPSLMDGKNLINS